MSHWSTPYLSVYEKSLEQIPVDTIALVRQKLFACQNSCPLVSVIAIAHNEERHLLSCLWSLSENRCNFPFEIMVINNNSTDQTEEILNKLKVTYFNELKKGPGHARQCGLNHAKGKFHICIDADTMYPPYYIETHVKALMKPDVVATFSLWSFIPDEKHSQIGLWFYESLRDIHLKIQSIKRPELCVRGMTFGFNTEIGRKFGFRTDIKRGEDGSLALAMKPYGKLVLITHRKARVLTGNATLDSQGSLLKNLCIRFFKALKGVTGLLFEKREYKDKKDNLL